MARLNTEIDVIKDPFKRQGVIDAILDGYDAAKTDSDRLFYSNLAAHIYAAAAADTFNIDQAEFQRFKVLEDAAVNAGLLDQATNIPATIGKMVVDIAEDYAQNKKEKVAEYSNDPAMAMLKEYMRPAFYIASHLITDSDHNKVHDALEVANNVVSTPVRVTQHVQGIYTDAEREQLSQIYKQSTPGARLDSLQRWRSGDVVAVANFALLASAASKVELPLTPPPSSLADSWSTEHFNKLAPVGATDLEVSQLHPKSKANPLAVNVMQMASDGEGNGNLVEGSLEFKAKILVLAARENNLDNLILLRVAFQQADNALYFASRGESGGKFLQSKQVTNIPDFETKFKHYLDSTRDIHANLDLKSLDFDEVGRGLHALSNPNKTYAANLGTLERISKLLADEPLDTTSFLNNNSLEKEVISLQRFPVTSIPHIEGRKILLDTIEDMVIKYPQLKELGEKVSAQLEDVIKNPDLEVESAKTRWFEAQLKNNAEYAHFKIGDAYLDDAADKIGQLKTNVGNFGVAKNEHVYSITTTEPPDLGR